LTEGEFFKNCEYIRDLAEMDSERNMNKLYRVSLSFWLSRHELSFRELFDKIELNSMNINV
jgi:hypothetical protein